MSRRLAGVVAVGLVPWTILILPGGIELVFAWGLLNTGPVHVVTLPEYLTYAGGYAGLPTRLRAWPLATGLYLLAVANVAVGHVRNREFVRVTAGLLVLAGVVHLRVSLGLGRMGRLAVPLGPAVLVTAAWWLYDGGSLLEARRED